MAESAILQLPTNVGAPSDQPSPSRFSKFPNEIKDMIAVLTVKKPGVLFLKIRRCRPDEKDSKWSIHLYTVNNTDKDESTWRAIKRSGFSIDGWSSKRAWDAEINRWYTQVLVKRSTSRQPRLHPIEVPFESQTDLAVFDFEGSLGAVVH